jgi:hypothetical protein
MSLNIWGWNLCFDTAEYGTLLWNAGNAKPTQIQSTLPFFVKPLPQTQTHMNFFYLTSLYTNLPAEPLALSIRCAAFHGYNTTGRICSVWGGRCAGNFGTGIPLTYSCVNNFWNNYYLYMSTSQYELYVMLKCEHKSDTDQWKLVVLEQKRY